VLSIYMEKTSTPSSQNTVVNDYNPQVDENSNITNTPLSSNNTLNEFSGWTKYRNEEYGIELYYPPDIFNVKNSGKSVIFYDKKSKEPQGTDFREIPNYFDIELPNLGGGSGLDYYANAIKQLFSSVPRSPIVILKSDEISVDGKRAVKLTFESSTNKTQKGFMVIAELSKVVSYFDAESQTTYKLKVATFIGITEDSQVAEKILKSIKFFQ